MSSFERSNGKANRRGSVRLSEWLDRVKERMDMSLSTCEKCGGNIPLGPDATNRCEKCGEFVFGNGLHPAKKPMSGGFSLDKFMAGVSKEDGEALCEMLDAMEAEKRLNGWTPVSNPPAPGHYLTFGSEEGIHTMAYTHETWFCHGHRETPTHWMQLPEPPAA